MDRGEIKSLRDIYQDINYTEIRDNFIFLFYNFWLFYFLQYICGSLLM